jgi:hypothetical protein
MNCNNVCYIFQTCFDHLQALRTQYSTEQAIFSLTNNILTAVNNNVKIGGIFCDLQKLLIV